MIIPRVTIWWYSKSQQCISHGAKPTSASYIDHSFVSIMLLVLHQHMTLPTVLYLLCFLSYISTYCTTFKKLLTNEIIPTTSSSWSFPILITRMKLVNKFFWKMKKYWISTINERQLSTYQEKIQVIFQSRAGMPHLTV